MKMQDPRPRPNPGPLGQRGSQRHGRGFLASREEPLVPTHETEPRARRRRRPELLGAPSWSLPGTRSPAARPAHLGPDQLLLNGGVVGFHVARELEVVDGVLVATVHSLRKTPTSELRVPRMCPQAPRRRARGAPGEDPLATQHTHCLRVCPTTIKTLQKSLTSRGSGPPARSRQAHARGAAYRVGREPAQDLEQGSVHLIRCPLVELPTAGHKQGVT